jgi:hypothetical protein
MLLLVLLSVERDVSKSAYCWKKIANELNFSAAAAGVFFFSSSGNREDHDYSSIDLSYVGDFLLVLTQCRVALLLSLDNVSLYVHSILPRAYAEAYENQTMLIF